MNSDNWYVDTIQVGEIEGDQVGLWTCLGCGSLVRGLFKETHEKWHQGTEGGWQVPGDLAERVAAADYRDAWGLEIKRTAEVREILQDLITELRAQHYADQCECGCEQWYECEPCSHISLCPTKEAAVRAEARLREVQGDQSASEQMFPIVNRELFDAVVKLNAANGVRASELKHIFTDLIAELRDEWETFTARDWNRAWYGCALAEATDRAEQRLQHTQQ